MSPARSIDDVLRGHGYRVTPARQVVWEVLRDAEEHLTVEEIANRVERRTPAVHLTSVYRSLTLLAELGLVRESRLGEGGGRWEVVHPDEHFHVLCRGCGAVTHHVGNLVEQIRGHLSTGHGFEADSVELVVHGFCAACLSTAGTTGSEPGQH